MSQVSIVRENAILPFQAATDLTGKEGHPVIVTNDTEVTLLDVSMGTVPPLGILVKGGAAGETVSVAIATGGLAGSVRVKLAGAVASVGTILELTETPDGCAFVPNTGGAVCYSLAIALETGLADEKIEAVLFRPQYI